MPLFVLGINHTTAPIEIRERTVFSAEKARSALQDLIKLEAVNEVMVLSTCNRTELVAEINAAQDAPNLLKGWLASQQRLNQDFLAPYLYSRDEQAAVQHIMRVASGLDSMVLGEPQILGQMKDAFALAKEAGSIGPKLGRLLPTVFAVTKQVRTDTAIGANPVSLAYAALRIAKRIFTEIKTCNLLCIGSGDMAKLVAVYLYEHGIQQITLVGRSAHKTQDLAKRIGAHCISFRDIPSYLHETDIIVSATASQLPILGKGAIESALKGRKHRPILMFDMAVPRDIEAEIRELEDVYLYNLDDLQEVVKEGYQSREQAATQAEVIIHQRATAFMCELMALEGVALIRDLRNNAEKICKAELQRARTALLQGIDAEKVLESLVRQLGNKLMHKPTLQLRQLAYSGQIDLLKRLKI